jgi:hypothetical protein
VQEFKVDNSTFAAEYGRNSGAIVNIATRFGTNQYSCEAFEFYRNDPDAEVRGFASIFGVITNTRFPTGDSGSSRQIQFAAKFLF